MKTEVIIVAAGEGKRFRSNTPKAFALLRNKPLVFHSLNTFQTHSCIHRIRLVVRKDCLKKAENIVKKYGFHKVKSVVAGGPNRCNSVINGLKTIGKDTRYILIHDGARPFVTKRLITRVLNGLKKYPAVIPGFAAQDTLKYVNKRKIVEKTLRRERVFHIQTPQGFRAEVIPLLRKKKGRGKAVYDDSLLVEDKIPVKVVESDSSNLKITRQQDIWLKKSPFPPS